MENQTLTAREEKAKRIVENSYFPVSKAKINDKRYNIVNLENGSILSEVSNRYTVVRNRDIFEPFVKQFGYGAIHKFYNYGKNRYYYMEIKTGRQFNFGTDEKPDVVDEILAISNSYNKTKSFTFRLGAFRWVCSNGLHSGEALVNYKKIHVGEIPVQKLVFEALLRYQDNTFDNWKRLKSVDMDENRRLEVIEGLKIFDETNKKGEIIESNARLNRYIKYTASWFVKKNRNEVDNQPNAWGLYNQINSAIERNIGGKSQIDRRVKANKEMEKYLLNIIG